MRRLTFSASLLAAGLLLAAPAFAQSGGAQGSSGAQQTQTGAQKQKTQSDVTNTYLFKTPGGNYTSGNAQKQRTDGEDVTGNNNFPAASK